MLIVNVQIKIDNKKIDSGNLRKLKISTSIDAVNMARVIFYDDPNDSFQDNKSFDMGKDITISIGFEKEAIEVFIGEIVRIDYLFERADSSVEIICYDKLFKLSRMRYARPFLNMKDSQIAKQMASEAGLEADIEITKKVHEYIFQNNESNLDFLRRRAERLGYELDIEDGKMIFKSARYKDKKPTIALYWRGDLIEFKIKLDSSEVVEEVIVTSWDSLKKETVEEINKAGDEDKVVSAKKLGTKEVKKKLKNKSKIYKMDIPNLQNAEAKEIGKSKLTSLSMKFLTARGVCQGEPLIKAGSVIEIWGVGEKFSGEYYITSAEHVYSADYFRTFFEVVSNGTLGKKG